MESDTNVAADDDDVIIHNDYCLLPANIAARLDKYLVTER